MRNYIAYVVFNWILSAENPYEYIELLNKQVLINWNLFVKYNVEYTVNNKI